MKPSSTPNPEHQKSTPNIPSFKVDSALIRSWHLAINEHSRSLAGTPNWPNFMYQAMNACSQFECIRNRFRDERERKLRVLHQQCSHSDPQPIRDNHLTCCLGTECRKCPTLLALNVNDISPDDQDFIKAWTCISHILQNGGDQMGEGFIITEDDKMFWARVHESLAQSSQP